MFQWPKSTNVKQRYSLEFGPVILMISGTFAGPCISKLHHGLGTTENVSKPQRCNFFYHSVEAFAIVAYRIVNPKVPNMCRIALDMKFWRHLTNIRPIVGFSVILGNGY